ncbi:MAG: hypothetical protein EBV53_12605, partial [Proteobacteria bacterium]|nr:hypothetical protein [Pseudomonadota bacterium]
MGVRHPGTAQPRVARKGWKYPGSGVEWYATMHGHMAKPLAFTGRWGGVVAKRRQINGRWGGVV